jgi:eukaryotic-like serine/threonine-protein kinase
MLGRERHESAAQILRECVAILEKKQPGRWTKFRAQSLLGVALFGQRRYAEAEPFLLQGYEGLKAREQQIPPPLGRHRVTEAGERIVRLYEGWGRVDKAGEWRTKLLSSGASPPHS